MEEAIIREIAPHALQVHVDALKNAETILAKWQLASPNALVAVIALACHETDDFTITRENMNYTTLGALQGAWPQWVRTIGAGKAKNYLHNPRTLADERYGKRMGNERNGTQDDDGFNYRGGGLNQLTGYDNYKECGEAIGCDLIAHPELIETADVSMQSLGWECSKFKRYADGGQDTFRAFSNAINRGNPLAAADPIGWKDRQTRYARVARALSHNPKAAGVVADLGAKTTGVRAAQEALKTLGYNPGASDGLFGKDTRDAVMQFQAENDLTITGKLDTATIEKLNSGEAVTYVNETKQTSTVADLRENGSTTIGLGDKTQQTVATLIGGPAVVKAADSSGYLDKFQEYLHNANMFTGLGDGFKLLIHWVAENPLIFAGIGGILIWRFQGELKANRLWEHLTGKNKQK